MLQEAINKLKLSLIVKDRYSPCDMFNSVNDKSISYSLPYYVNIYAKQIHLIAINQGEEQLLSVTNEGEYN